MVKSGEHTGANITLPSELGQLSDLTRLSLRDHNHTLTGDIPSEIGQLSRLAVLELGHSSLHGDLPMQLASLTSLRILDLARTDVAGTDWLVAGIISVARAVEMRSQGGRCIGNTDITRDAHCMAGTYLSNLSFPDLN